MLTDITITHVETSPPNIAFPAAIGCSVTISTSGSSHLDLQTHSFRPLLNPPNFQSNCTSKAILTISCSPSGEFFYTGSGDNSVRKWNAELCCINVAKGE